MKALEAKRLPLLEEREAARKRGDDVEVLRCNAELCRLNLAIQGVQPYEEAAKPVQDSKPTSKTRKKKTQDVLA
jgi:hypothetical protein